jgi:hypothetical protein
MSTSNATIAAYVVQISDNIIRIGKTSRTNLKHKSLQANQIHSTLFSFPPRAKPFNSQGSSRQNCQLANEKQTLLNREQSFKLFRAHFINRYSAHIVTKAPFVTQKIKSF